MKEPVEEVEATMRVKLEPYVSEASWLYAIIIQYAKEMEANYKREEFYLNVNTLVDHLVTLIAALIGSGRESK